MQRTGSTTMALFHLKHIVYLHVERSVGAKDRAHGAQL